MRSSAPAGRGFTLLEMILVLGIVAGMASMLAFNIVGRMDSVKAAGAAREAAAALRYTRAYALRSQEAQVLLVDLEKKTITAPLRQPIVLPENVEMKLLTASEELSSRKAGGIRFFRDGGSTGGKLTLSTGGRTWEIAVSWLTGEISLADSAKPQRR